MLLGCGGRAASPAFDASTDGAVEAEGASDGGADAPASCTPGVVSGGEAGARCSVACQVEVNGRDESYCSDFCGDAGCPSGLTCFHPGGDLSFCGVPCAADGGCPFGACSTGLWCQPHP